MVINNELILKKTGKVHKRQRGKGSRKVLGRLGLPTSLYTRRRHQLQGTKPLGLRVI